MSLGKPRLHGGEQREDPGVDERIILKWTSSRGLGEERHELDRSGSG
jgi:hypothetical protein